MTHWRCGVIGVLLVLGSSNVIIAATHEVDCAGGGDYVTVQEAVDAAANGDTILIAPCVYDEEVRIIGKSLTFVGGGAEVTELLSSSSAPPVMFDDGLTPDGLILSSLSITRNPIDEVAIRWHGGELTLDACEVSGGVVHGTMEHATASVDISSSQVTRLRVAGGMRTSTIGGSRVGQAEFAGGGFSAPGHSLYTSGSFIGELTVYDCQAHSDADSIGTAWIYGNVDVWGELHTVNSSIDHLVAYDCAATELTECSVGALDYYSDYYELPDLILRSTLVTGDFVLGPGSARDGVPSRGRPVDGRQEGDLLIQHNTFLGSFDYELPTDLCWYPLRHIRSNIVLGVTSILAGDCVAITHNDFVGGATISAPGDSIFSNFSYPPLFCDMFSGDYTLEDCSPCVGAAHDGGDIGAFGVGCVCSGSPIRESSWGRIKAGYRQLSN